MRLAILFPLTLTALLASPQAHADDDPAKTPPTPNVAEAVWETHVKTFDLDGDGRITWEEYQKVTSGFAHLDSDKDGAITKEDLGKLGATLEQGLGAHGAHVVLGMPGRGIQRSFTLPVRGGTGDLSALLPLLMGLVAPSGHPCMCGAAHGQVFPHHPGVTGGFGPQGWMSGAQGGCGQRGGDAQMLMQLLPLLLQGRQGALAPTTPPSQAPILQGPHHQVTTRTFTSVFPEGMKGVAAFGMVAHQADEDGDHVITREEWDTAVRAITKEDGTLDVTALEKGVQVHGMPMPGGEGSIFRTLLDADGNGRLEAADLEGVFEAMDKNDDGKVEAGEMVPSGMHGLPEPHAR